VEEDGLYFRNGRITCILSSSRVPTPTRTRTPTTTSASTITNTHRYHWPLNKHSVAADKRLIPHLPPATTYLIIIAIIIIITLTIIATTAIIITIIIITIITMLCKSISIIPKTSIIETLVMVRKVINGSFQLSFYLLRYLLLAMPSQPSPNVYFYFSYIYRYFIPLILFATSYLSLFIAPRAFAIFM
jgi:hypothetical protein